MPQRPWQVDVPQLFPPRVSDWLGPEKALIDYLITFVSEVDLIAVGLDDGESSRGASRFNRKMLLAMWLFGLLKGIRSCRKLEEACRLRVDFPREPRNATQGPPETARL